MQYHCQCSSVVEQLTRNEQVAGSIPIIGLFRLSKRVLFSIVKPRPVFDRLRRLFLSELIQPQVLKGFIDSLPQKEIPKRRLMAKLEAVFEKFGFVPIDTPALEYTEVLLGKGGGETDKQMFRFEDNGGRDVALRFDLTVPFARFVAANRQEFSLPFKRYHMAKVWRGEKPQKGRYREFFQCDFDTVGLDTAAADFEILQVMARSLETLDVGGFTIHVSHRAIFNRFLDKEGALEHSTEILRCVDKLPKIGREEVQKLLGELVSGSTANKILDYIACEDGWDATLDKMEKYAGGEAEDTLRLRRIGQLIAEVGLTENFKLDPAITRGLDYYTGIVYETFLTALPGIGSVCSGGRYNNLAGLYTKEHLPGVGASVGLDRLLAALDELGKNPAARGSTQVLILNLEDTQLGSCLRLAEAFRAAGVAAEVFLDQKKIAQQFKYAETKTIPWAIFLNKAEGDHFEFNLKNVATGQQSENLNLQESLHLIQQDLGGLK